MAWGGGGSWIQMVDSLECHSGEACDIMDQAVHKRTKNNQRSQFARDRGVSWDTELSVIKAGKSSANQDELGTLE